MPSKIPYFNSDATKYNIGEIVRYLLDLVS